MADVSGTFPTSTILLVDDRQDNLLALSAILEPLGQTLVTATSGEDALKRLLDHDVALILLDVQMPGMDGFETATFIKRREKTRHVPIIFLTAESGGSTRIFEGYSVGAVDFISKPFEPLILRTKVQTFIELHRREQDVRVRLEQLETMEEAHRVREVERAQREGQERYESLAEAMPQIVWVADAHGNVHYYNQRWYDYTGMTRAETHEHGWALVVHPDDDRRVRGAWRDAVQAGTPFELEYRLRGADGVHRWQLGRALPTRNAEGHVVSWVATSTDIDDRKQIERTRDFLIAGSARLSATLDYRLALRQVAELAAQSVADWCSIDLIGADDHLERVALAHSSAVNRQLAGALKRHTPDPSTMSMGVRRVLELGEARLVPSIDDMLDFGDTDDREFLEVAAGLGLCTWVCVPVQARGKILGLMSFLRSGPGSRYGTADLEVAREMALRAAAAIDIAELYHKAEERAQAALVLQKVGDGVVLVDDGGVVRLWNAAAEVITGVHAQDVVGRAAVEAIPGWEHIAPILRDIAARASRGGGPRAETVPLEVDGRDVWLSVSGVVFDEGTVYAFRDITEQQMVDKMKSDFVATVSHELRTPLSAIFGAASTITRADLKLPPDARENLLDMILEQSERLSEMINDLLLASRLDSGQVTAVAEDCDAGRVAADVVEGVRAWLPEDHRLELHVAPNVPEAHADAGHLRQVLGNLIENAVKYSPQGGEVRLAVTADESCVRFRVTDEGIGIPEAERERVFEKFYRLDANMTRGIGGSGLGLYICRELVKQMSGHISIEGVPGGGSAFNVDVPMGTTPRPTSAPAPSNGTGKNVAGHPARQLGATA
jgi:PAS domain S-box-containing protein